MAETPPQDVPFNIADLPDFPETDETGDVDMSLIDCNLAMSIADRIRGNDGALPLYYAMLDVRRKLYGNLADPEETD